MRRWSGNFESKLKNSFLAGIFIMVSLLLLLFYVAYCFSLVKQQKYSLMQNFDQSYEGINSITDRVEKLSRQFSVGTSLEMLQVFRREPVKNDVEMFENLTEYTDMLEFSMGDISIYYYIDDDFSVVHRNGLHYRPISTAEGETWYENLKKNNGRNTWFSFACDEYDPENYSMSLARYISDSDNFGNQIGVLVLSVDTESLKRAFTRITERQLIYLEDRSGTVFASSDPEYSDYQRLQQSYPAYSMEEYEKRQVGEDRYFLRRCEVGNTGMYMVSVVPYEYMYSIYSRAALWGFSCFFLILFLAVLYVSLMSKRLTKPLTELTESISAATVSGHLEMLRTESSEKEILMLVSAYNMLIQKTEVLLKQQYQLGKEKMQAELMALQSQINPHFLYNTLEMVNWMAERNEKENVQTVIQKMSAFYRLVLSNGRDVITIGEEVTLCETYLAIQQMRFRGKIRYERDIEEEILSYRIPKITLQPFVENAVIHGITASAQGRGTISMNGWIEDGRITLAVTDDGSGMVKDQSDSKGSHYGMKNIEKRLSVYFQEDIHVEIESTRGIGTCVSVNIPAWSREMGENMEK